MSNDDGLVFPCPPEAIELIAIVLLVPGGLITIPTRESHVWRRRSIASYLPPLKPYPLVSCNDGGRGGESTMWQRDYSNNFFEASCLGVAAVMVVASHHASLICL